MTRRGSRPRAAARRTPVTPAGRWAKPLLGVLAALLWAAGTQAQAVTVQITCPPSQSVPTDRSDVQANVTTGTATSSTAGATVFGVRSDGKALSAPYPVGTTSILWTAMVGQDTNTCTQTITVERIFIVPSFTTVVIGQGSANPHIDSLSPMTGPLNQKVLIHGSGFADVQGTGYVTVGGRQVPVLSWTAGAIVIVMNPFAQSTDPLALNAPYPVQVITPSSGKKSNTVDFLLTDAAPAVYVNPSVAAPSDQPSFGNLQRSLFCPGDVVAFMGAGFGQTQGAGYVTVDVPLMDGNGNIVHQTFAVPVLSWADNQISFVLNLPAGAIPGTYSATIHRGNGKTTSASFQVGTRNSSGNCVGQSPLLQVTPTALDFGTVNAGVTSATKSITVMNNGTAPLILNSIVPGGDSSFFTTSAGCPTGSANAIPVGGHCTINVAFTSPANATSAPHSATLMITSNGGTATVTLTGTVAGAAQQPSTPSVTGVACGLTNNVSTLTITGSNFGASQGTGTVAIQGPSLPSTNASVISWSDTSIVVQAPTDTANMVITATGSTYTVTVKNNGGQSGSGSFTGGQSCQQPSAAAPQVTNVTCVHSGDSGPAGVVTITGSNFGATQGTGSVTVSGMLLSGDVTAQVLAWSDTTIMIQAPDVNDPMSGMVPFTDEGFIYTVTVHRADGQTASGTIDVSSCKSSKS